MPRRDDPELCGRENAVMNDGFEETEIAEIEQRAAQSFRCRGGAMGRTA